MMQLPDVAGPVVTLLNQINRAALGDLHLVAIGMAVALPDMCAALISPNGETTGRQYKDWCRSNISEGNDFASPEELWAIRCGVLHTGRVGDLKHQVSQVIFVPPGPGVFSNCRFNDTYVASVDVFCGRITDTVASWLLVNAEHPTVVANLPRIMRYRPEGFEKLIQGALVIA